MPEPPADETAFSYDLIADVYDDDMGRNVGSADIDFYVERCASARDEPVLELGCGTGRITLPLVTSGRTVVGVDRSAAMLERLRAKADAVLTPAQRARVDWRRADMADCDLGMRFARVLCPYSAFTYLVDDERRARALDNVRRQLGPRGLFVLDVFVPDARVRTLPAEHVFFDYRRRLGDGTELERTKQVRCESADVNVITRHYAFFDGGGAVRKRITTVDRIRVYQPDELRRVLEQHGFDVIETLADFRPQLCAPETKMAAFVCRAAESGRSAS
ncbi:MAG TPA: methyltransferase domain-containing protein [Candidatus Elarobacter sp.]